MIPIPFTPKNELSFFSETGFEIISFVLWVNNDGFVKFTNYLKEYYT